MFQEVVGAGELKPSGKRQRYWGPINENRISGDSQGEKERGKETCGEHPEAVESAERVCRTRIRTLENEVNHLLYIFLEDVPFSRRTFYRKRQGPIRVAVVTASKSHHFGWEPTRRPGIVVDKGMVARKRITY